MSDAGDEKLSQDCGCAVGTDCCAPGGNKGLQSVVFAVVILAAVAVAAYGYFNRGEAVPGQGSAEKAQPAPAVAPVEEEAPAPAPEGKKAPPAAVPAEAKEPAAAAPAQPVASAAVAAVPPEVQLRRLLAEKGFAFVLLTGGDAALSAKAEAAVADAVSRLTERGGDVGVLSFASGDPGVGDLAGRYGVSDYPAALAVREHGGEHFIGEGITLNTLVKSYLASAQPASSCCGAAEQAACGCGGGEEGGGSCGSSCGN